MTNTADSLTGGSQFFGDTIFCDDIRYELGGKVSYIGVYNGVLYLSPDQTFPAVVSKLSLQVRLYMPISVDPDRIEIMVYFPEDKDDAPTFRHVFENIPARQNVVSDAQDIQLRGIFATPLMFSPAPLAATGSVKVRAKIGEEIIRLGSLFIRKQPEAVFS